MRLRIVAAVFASAAAALLSGCAGKTTSLLCKGTVQKVGKPETILPVDSLAASVTKFPLYVKAWSNSYGEFRLSGVIPKLMEKRVAIGEQVAEQRAAGRKQALQALRGEASAVFGGDEPAHRFGIELVPGFDTVRGAPAEQGTQVTPVGAAGVCR